MSANPWAMIFDIETKLVTYSRREVNEAFHAGAAVGFSVGCALSALLVWLW